MSLSLKYTILLADGLFIFKGKTEDVGIAKISGSYLEANISKCRASCFAVQLPMSVGGQGKKKFGKAQFLCLPDCIPCWSDGHCRRANTQPSGKFLKSILVWQLQKLSAEPHPCLQDDVTTCIIKSYAPTVSCLDFALVSEDSGVSKAPASLSSALAPSLRRTPPLSALSSMPKAALLWN